MYHPTSRVLAVLEMLQSHRRMTGVELARRLEVNIRTLRHYITQLQDLGIPIIAERGRHGAYMLGAGYRLPPMMFSNDEALVLELGLLAAGQLGLTEQGFAIESSRAKLEHVMPPELKAHSRALSRAIELGVKAHASAPSTRIMLALSNAVHLRQQVYLRCQPETGEPDGQFFDPYCIAFHRGQWYVVGWCHLRQTIRSFRMDRILAASLSEVTFLAPDNFDALPHIQQSLPDAYSFEVLLKTDLPTAQHYIYDLPAVPEAHADGVLMRGTTEDLHPLARVLAGLPFAFEVYRPFELRQAVRDHAAELTRLVDK